jgi:adenylosuccinate synthase
MPATILVGAQWGDEGKGRVVDWLAAEADVVARYGGGDNAGHTVYIGDKVYKFHLVPSGVLREGVVSVLGSGMVINPVKLLKEMDEVQQQGVVISPERLIISTRAHIISPAHIALDKASEQALGEKAIGTTQRGIGPAYLDKAGRQGIRAGQMIHIETFADALENAIARANETLRHQGMPTIDAHAEIPAYIEAAQRLKPYLSDTTIYLNECLRAGKRILCEGAQGTLLDLDHGSYPFVTSSSTSVGGALTGLGFGPQHVNRVVGVAKCFSTRVGGGPMPTEDTGDLGSRLRGTGEHFWDEFGTTTGRARRCGWLDAVLLRYSAMMNGLSELVLTKLDILSGFDEIGVAVAYEIDGQRVDYPPSTNEELERAKPIYEMLRGWHEDITTARQLSDLPSQARAYIKRIEELCGVPVRAASVGPEREQLVIL